MPRQKVPDTEDIVDLAEVFASNSGVSINRDAERHSFVNDIAIVTKPRTTRGGLERAVLRAPDGPLDYLR